MYIHHTYIRAAIALFVCTTLLLGGDRLARLVDSGLSLVASAGGVLLTVTIAAPTATPPPSSGGSSAGGAIATTPPTTPTTQTTRNPVADISVKGKVDIADFSILAYWYKRPLTADARAMVDLNHDGSVTLVDFSILAYYWHA